MEAEAGELPAFRELAAGLRRDLAAVTAARHDDWSTGRTEWPAPRITLAKRMQDGRGPVDVRQRRLLRSAYSTPTAQSASLRLPPAAPLDSRKGGGDPVHRRRSVAVVGPSGSGIPGTRGSSPDENVAPSGSSDRR
ncbi:MAG: hypothetical protein ACR2PL_10955 [Dehalococcoidia bacterium]